MLGPLTVSPRQIMDLGSNFATFVNELLRLELASVGLAGGHLTTTYRENLSDKGVDTGLHLATATDYVPPGDSAWQFKAGDLEPKKCRTELAKATEALDVLRAGGVYRLVLGADLTSEQVRKRRFALEEKAAELGIEVRPDTFVVLNASALAEWASGYPALALSPLVGGLSDVAVPFETWSTLRGMTGVWAESISRQMLAAEVRRTVGDPSAAPLHVEGVSGLGKTRGVLEALRGHEAEPLVVYVPAADHLTPQVLHHLHTQGRHAVLVVDECDARQHERLSEQLPPVSTVCLITIGQPGGYRPPVTPYRLDGLESHALWQMIQAEQPSLPREHRQLVVDVANGNAKLAKLLADHIATQPRTTVVELLTEDVIGSFVTRALPQGTAFLACCVLALLPTVGFQDGPGEELACLATAFRMAVQDLQSAALDLDRANLVSWQGRYRAIGPNPLALYLAAHAWRHLQDQIEQQLLPALDLAAAERLFRRAADCGALDTARPVVQRQLAHGGRYAELDLSGRGSESMLLVHFAVLAPKATCAYLETWLAGINDEGLSAMPSQTVLIWALERLAWHTATFHRAAELLLRLAAIRVTAGQTPSGNLERSGAMASWTDLFGHQLPTTAAGPDTRLRYLRAIATSADQRRRSLSVEAARRMLSIHEVSSSSAAAQGAVLVEPPGVPTDLDQALRYVRGAIDLLAELATDAQPAVAAGAVQGLVSAIQPWLSLSRPEVHKHLACAVAALPPTGVTAARVELGRLEALFERTHHLDLEQDAVRRDRLRQFRAHLPVATPHQELDALVGAGRWDFRDGSLPGRLADAARALPEDGVRYLLEALETRPDTGFEIGHALAQLAPDDVRVRDQLRTRAAVDQEPLVGYLRACVRGGASQAFDDLLDRPDLAAWDERTLLRLSTEGPPTTRAWTRVSTLLSRVEPATGASALQRWHEHLTGDRLQTYLADWLPRVVSREDYAAVLDLVALVVQSRPDEIESMDDMITDVVVHRRQHPHLPDFGAWAWAPLARRQLTSQPAAVLTVLMDLVEADDHVLTDTAGESLVRDAVEAAGARGWRMMMDRTIQGSRRVRLAGGRWLGNATDVNTVREWIGGDLERARTLAKLTGPAPGGLSATARFLITEFGADEGVAWSLRHCLLPVISSGSELTVYQRLLEQMTDDQPSRDSDRVVEWLQETIDWLRALLVAARRSAEI